MNIILYAIPVFFLLIGVELLAEKLRGSNYYRVNDAITSLSAGVLSRMFDLVKNLIPFTLYILFYENLALFTLPDSVWVWIFAFVAYDFCYYWNHRFGHEVSIFWASHVVHHSSEDYNLTTALRQSSSGFLSFIFYLPLALLGIEPLLLVSVAALNLVYQFWVHTQHIPKLGVFEWVFVTPSNHRVHHAQNSLYLDRNYGGVFIVWDRMFGSFQEELDEEKPIYGVRKALKSWNPLWANIQVYSQLCKDSYHTARWRDKIKVWFGRTGWRPEDVTLNYPLVRVDLSKFKRFDPPVDTATKIYCLLQYTVTAAIGVVLMINAANMTLIDQIGVALGVIYSCVSIGWLLERKSTAIFSELFKCLLILVLASKLMLATPLTYFLIGSSVISLLLLIQIHTKTKLPKYLN